MSYYERQANLLTIIGIVTGVLIAILSPFISPLFLEYPSLQIFHDYKAITVKNHGKGDAKIVKILFKKDDEIYCFSDSNFSQFTDMDYLKYEPGELISEENPIIPSGADKKIMTCDECKDIDYNLVIEKIEVLIEYEGSNFLSKRKTTCSGTNNCVDDFQGKNPIPCE